VNDINAIVGAVKTSERKAATGFLSAVWGTDANGALTHVHLIALKLKGFKHFDARTAKEAADLLVNSSSSGRDTYFGCATFSTPNNRTAANALGAHSFWLDVDAGPGKPYADQVEGLKALKAFCKATGLPKPSRILSSGNGLHCYWHFAQFINAKEWVVYAGRLKSLAHAKGFHPDPQRTADIASVLRVPGTRNWKEPDNPKPVELLHASPALDLAKFVAVLDANSPPAPPPVPANNNVGRCVPLNTHNIRVILSMLSALPDIMAADYDTWLRIGFAIHAFNNGKVGLALWKKFSMRCPEKAAATDFEKVWSGFKRPYEGRAITIGTLWKLATDHGWRPTHFTTVAL
jgi:Primase C terminal 2 (PriCT-2)